MLQKMHERMQGIVAGAIIIVLCLAFGLWGIQYYLQSKSDSDVAAKVNGVKISKYQMQNAYQRAQQLAIAKMGKNYSFDQAAQAKLKHKVLQQLIKEQAFYQDAVKLGFRVGIKQLDAALMQIPAFQVNGQFSQARFQQILSNMLYTEDDFFAEMSRNIIVNQLQSGVVSSAFVLPEELNKIVQLITQKRDIGYTVIPLSRFINKVKIDQSDIQLDYQHHKKDYTIPEQVSIAYVELSIDKLQLKDKITDTELQQYYDDNIDIYSHPARWQIERIFVPVAANAPSAQVSTAQKHIAKLAKQAANGAGFSKLDFGNGKAKWVLAGQLSTDFVAQLKQLKPGQISKPFRTAAGYYLVKLLAMKPAETLSFKQVYNQVKKAYMHQKLSNYFDQQKSKLSELAYTNSDNLTAVSKQLNLPIQTTKLFPNHVAKEGLLANAKVIKAAFSNTVLQQKYNSDPIDLQPGKTIVLRINKYQPETVKPLAAVKDEIVKQLKQQAAQLQAEALGKELLQQIEQDKSAASLAAKYGLIWKTANRIGRKQEKINPQIVQTAFALNEPEVGKTTESGVVLKDGGYAIVQVSKVYPGSKSDLSADKLHLLNQAIGYGLGEADFNTYANELVKRAKVKTYPQ